MAKKDEKGKGIAALLDDAPAINNFPTVTISDITPDPNQPRQFYDEVAMNELTESVKIEGVLQPILLRPGKGKTKYMIVFGERRFRAAKAAGLKEIPAMVRNMTDDEALQAQIVENLQRKDVHPMEEAVAFKSIIDNKGWTNEEVANRVGKNVYYVRQRMKLNNLSDDFRKLFYRNAMSVSTALKLASFSKEIQQDVYSNKIDEDDLSNEKFEFELNEWSLNSYKGKLSTAVFSLQDDSLIKGVGACTNCQFNSAVMNLFPNDNETAQCNNVKCFNSKTERHFDVQMALAKEDPTVIFVSTSYGTSAKDLKKFTDTGIEVLKYNEFETFEAPDYPDMDEYRENLEDTYYDTEQEMMDAFNKDVAEYQKDLLEYQTKIASGKFNKAFVVIGNNKGAYIHITLKNKSKDKSSGNSGTAKDSVNTDDIDSEISRLKIKENRSKELDDIKVWDEIKPHFSPNNNASMLKHDLEAIDMKAIAKAMYNKIGYQNQESFRKLFKYDARTNTFPTPDKTTFAQMCRFFMFDQLPPAEIYSGFTPDAKLSLELADRYFPTVISEIKLKQEEITNKRIEKVNKRIKELQAKKKELSAKK